MMEIRLAEHGDLQGILAYDSHIPQRWVSESIQNRRMTVLCDGGHVAGVLRYSLFWQTIPFLDLIYIDQAQRGQGYGRQMMAYWEMSMKDMGYKYVMLSTQADESAKDFYEKLGYRRIGAFLPPEQDVDEIMYLKML